MNIWFKHIQTVAVETDRCILERGDASLTLAQISAKLGYSEYHVSKKFREVSGMTFRRYLHCRKLAFALRDIRDTDRGILDIALDYGFSSHEAFTRAFGKLYGVTPSQYRKTPVPVILRTVIKPYDCFLAEHGGNDMKSTSGEVRTYFVKIPAHKFMHIRSYDSIGYFDFWQKQSLIPGHDCDTICGLLSGIPHKLDDLGGSENDSSAGQIMAFVNEPTGRLCSWGIPLAECYGIRLPCDYDGPVPEQFILSDVGEGEYLVFEHGPFDFETENAAVEQKIEKAMREFDYAASGYELDLTQGRMFYFYHDCSRYWKYIRPVVKTRAK